MSQAKKVVKASAPKKAEPKPLNRAAVKDSTEIDDLFSLLSSAKKAITPEPPASAIKVDEGEDAKTDEVTLSELEGLEDTDVDDFEDTNDSEELVKGVAYDHKKDDIFPGTSKDTTPANTATASVCNSDFFDSRGLKRKTRPLTQDGLPIYSPKELKIGMGGGTDLCPFDCNCCY